MLNKKSAILVGISMLVGLQLSYIYVPDGFEKPLLFRTKSAIGSVLFYMAKFAASLNNGHEAGNFRNILKLTTSLFKMADQDIKTVDTKIKDVNVRIYSQLASTSKNLPILIFYHGGAFVFGDVESYDLYLSTLVKRLNLVAIFVDYKMAPEYPFPTPTNDCYSVAKYVIDNAKEFNGDSSRVILAGDSAGGNAVALVSQRLLAEKSKQPKLQVLIYPWTQMFNFQLPSSMQYSDKRLVSSLSLARAALWYLGIHTVSNEMEHFIMYNNHTNLITDANLKNKLKSYVDVNLIPEKYKTGKSYYQDYETRKNYVFPKTNLQEFEFLKNDKKMAGLVKNLFTVEASPALAEPEKLKGLPRAYFVMVEWDSLKDEGLIYSERLRQAGVQVDVAFYEKAFHGIASLIHPTFGYKIAVTMLDDLTKFIQENI